MIVSVGKSWPSGLWESRKGNSSSNSSGKSLSSMYGLPIRLDKTPNGAAVTPLRAQRKALQQIREGKGGTISDWFSTTMLDIPTTTPPTTTKNNNNNNNTRKRKRKRKWWAK